MIGGSRTLGSNDEAFGVHFATSAMISSPLPPSLLPSLICCLLPLHGAVFTASHFLLVCVVQQVCAVVLGGLMSDSAKKTAFSAACLLPGTAMLTLLGPVRCQLLG